MAERQERGYHTNHIQPQKGYDVDIRGYIGPCRGFNNQTLVNDHIAIEISVDRLAFNRSWGYFGHMGQNQKVDLDAWLWKCGFNHER